MKTTTLYITCALTCIILFTACKKYPEGGIQSKGPKNIIGSWLLTLYEVDGIDSTNLINYNGNEDYKKVTITTPSSSSKEIHLVIQGGIAVVYTIKFGSNNETFNGELYYFDYKGARPCDFTGCLKQYFTPETNNSTWKVLKLDSKEMHLQSQQIHAYSFKFVKVAN